MGGGGGRPQPLPVPPSCFLALAAPVSGSIGTGGGGGGQGGRLAASAATSSGRSHLAEGRHLCPQPHPCFSCFSGFYCSFISIAPPAGAQLPEAQRRRPWRGEDGWPPRDRRRCVTSCFCHFWLFTCQGRGALKTHPAGAPLSSVRGAGVHGEGRDGGVAAMSSCCVRLVSS